MRVVQRLGLSLAPLIASSACALALAGPDPTTRIDAADALADVVLLERVLNVLHPGLDRYSPQAELDAGMERLRRAVSGGTTDGQMYLEISRFLELIRCDHTKAEYPESLRTWRELNPSFLPIQTRIIGERLFVGASRTEGLDPGDEILSINGEPSSRIIEEVEALISIDGFTDHARADEAELSSEYLGSGIDTFLPLLRGFSSRFSFTVRSGDDAPIRTVETAALTLGDYQAIDPGADVRNFKDAVSIERLDDRTALLRVDTFVNYREPVDPDTVFGPIMRSLNESGVEHLIVDLRRNGGGSDDAAISLFRHLISEPVRAESLAEAKTLPIPDDVKQAVTTWDMDALNLQPTGLDRGPSGMWRLPDGGEIDIAPAIDHFKGRVTALSSRGNASGSTLLLASLQSQANVRIVGEPTGGSVEGPTAGLIAFCRLPSCGVTVRVPLIRSYTGLSSREPGMGVTPDLVVWRTVEGFRAGRDEALEAARR